MPGLLRLPGEGGRGGLERGQRKPDENESDYFGEKMVQAVVREDVVGGFDDRESCDHIDHRLTTDLPPFPLARKRSFRYVGGSLGFRGLIMADPTIYVCSRCRG